MLELFYWIFFRSFCDSTHISSTFKMLCCPSWMQREEKEARSFHYNTIQQQEREVGKKKEEKKSKNQIRVMKYL